MSPRVRTNGVFSLLIAVVTVQTAGGDTPVLDEMPLEEVRIGVDFVEQEFDESQILNDIAVPVLQVLFGGTSVFEGVTELVEVMIEAAFEGGMDEGQLNIEDAMEQMRPLMISELQFVRLACPDLPMEHRLTVRAAAEARLKELAERSSSNPTTEEQEETVGVLLDQRRDSLSEMRNTITDSLKPLLTDLQFRQYEEMASDRVAQRKHAAIIGSVSRIDGQLLLSPQQRENIIEAISTNWRPRWEQWAVMQGFQDDYLPKLPAELVTSFLNDTQKEAWQTLQKIDFDEIWSDEDVDGHWNDGWWGEVEPPAEEHGVGILIEKRAADF